MPPRTILVVDDEPGVRSSLRVALRKGKYRVLEASSALEALFVCACHPVDLLLTDVEMPGIDGLRLAEKFSYSFPAVPVIYMSAGRGHGEALAKPVDPEAVVQRVHRALESAAPARECFLIAAAQKMQPGRATECPGAGRRRRAVRVRSTAG